MVADEDTDPVYFKMAISSESSIRWQKAMEEEYQALIENETCW